MINVLYMHRPKTLAGIDASYFPSLEIEFSFFFKVGKLRCYFFRAQRLINLEIPVLMRSLKSSNVELG